MAECRRFNWRSLRGITIWGVYIDLLLALLFFAFIALLVHWKFALIIMGALLFHESGHAWGMKLYKIPIKGFYFIPLGGLVVVPMERWKTRRAETDIAILGPVWGLVSVIAIWIIWRLTGSQVVAGVAYIVSFINLLNLLPINPLDGGRIIKSLGWSMSRRIGLLIQVLGVIGAIVILGELSVILAMIVAGLGTVELLGELTQYRRHKDRQNIMKEVSRFLSAEMGLPIEPIPEDITAGLKIYHGTIDLMTPEMEKELMDYYEKKSPETIARLRKLGWRFKEFAHDIPVIFASSARKHWWTGWKKKRVVGLRELECHQWPAENWPLIDFLKEEQMTAMSFREGSWRFLAYLALLNALIYLYVTTSQVCDLFQLIDLL